MIVKPAISLIGGKNISFNLISINGIGQKIAYGSYDTSMVQVEFMEDKYDGIISDIDILTIHTSYKNAWYGLFKTLMDSPRANSDLKDNYAIIDTVDNEITLDFSSCSDKPDLYLNIVEIGAQISPGWIE